MHVCIAGLGNGVYSRCPCHPRSLVYALQNRVAPGVPPPLRPPLPYVARSTLPRGPQVSYMFVVGEEHSAGSVIPMVACIGNCNTASLILRASTYIVSGRLVSEDNDKQRPLPDLTPILSYAVTSLLRNETRRVVGSITSAVFCSTG